MPRSMGGEVKFGEFAKKTLLPPGVAVMSCG